MTARHFNHLLNLSLLLLLLALGLGLYPDLPERIPTHFGIDGQADGFANKSVWWRIIGIQAGVAAFLYALGLFLTDRGFNRKLLRRGPLTQGQQAQIAERSRTILFRTTTLFLFLAISLVVSIHQAAQQSHGRLGATCLLALALVVIYPMVAGIRLRIEAHRLIRANRAGV